MDRCTDSPFVVLYFDIPKIPISLQTSDLYGVKSLHMSLRGVHVRQRRLAL